MARRPLWPLLAAFASFGVFWGSWAALVPAMRDRADASVSELGLAILGVAIGALPAMLGTGVAVDRWGARLPPATLAAFGLAVLVPLLATSPLQLGAALVVVGAASGALDVAINAAVSEWENTTGRRAMSAAHAVYSAGVVVGAIGAGLARDLGAGAPLVLGTCAAVLCLAAIPNVSRRRSVAAEADHRPRLDFSRRVLVLGLLCALGFLVEGGIENWSALYVEDSLGGSALAGGLAPGLFAASMVAGRVLAQALGHRYRDSTLLAAAGIVAAVGVSLAAATDSVFLALVGFSIGGAGVSVVAPVTFGAAGRDADAARRGVAVGSVTTFGYLGFLVGPPLVGGASGATSLRAGLLVLVLVALLLTLASGAVRARSVSGGRRGRSGSSA
jgi:MFS family permease